MAKREHFLREAMTIAIPVALQAMLQSSFSMIDQLMVGQFGKTAIAAVEVGGKPQFVFAFVSGAIATVTGIMVSQYMGKNDQKKINTSMSVNLLVMLCLALFTMGLCLIFPDVLAGIFTKDTEVVVTAKPYIQILAWVYPLSGVATLLAVQLRCRNYAKYPLYISAVAAVVNTCLNYLLIFGHFGFPAMGIKGAALASLMSQVVNLALMVYFYHRTCQFSFDLRMKASEISQYLIILMPIVVNELLWTLGQNVNTYIYGHMGTSELAGMSLTGPIQGLFIGALSGLSQAAGILIGRRLGEHDYERAYHDSKRLCFYGFVGSLILSIFLVVGENLYIDLYNVGPDVRQVGSQLLLTFAILAPVKVQNMILGGGIIRSGGRTKYIMIIDILGTWCIGVPLGLFTGLVLKLPIVWVYFILSQEELFRFIVSVFMFRSRKWMNTIK